MAKEEAVYGALGLISGTLVTLGIEQLRKPKIPEDIREILAETEVEFVISQATRDGLINTLMGLGYNREEASEMVSKSMVRENLLPETNGVSLAWIGTRDKLGILGQESERWDFAVTLVLEDSTLYNDDYKEGVFTISRAIEPLEYYCGCALVDPGIGHGSTGIIVRYRGEKIFDSMAEGIPAKRWTLS